jgi:hypothetical protein
MTFDRTSQDQDRTRPSSVSRVPAARTSPDRRVTRGDTTSVACRYCAGSIPASAFIYWTRESRLLSADCPDCTRRTTLAVRGLGPLPIPGERGITVVDRSSTLELVDIHA